MCPYFPNFMTWVMALEVDSTSLMEGHPVRVLSTVVIFAVIEPLLTPFCRGGR